MMSSSQLLAKVITFSAHGSVEATHDCACVMCGGDIAAGEWVEPFDPPASFTEYGDLQNPNGTHICVACKAVWRKEFMQTYTKSIVCSEGVFPFFSNDAVTYWLQNPPEPPFSLFISTQQLGHIVWKAPVNWSREVLFVRYNDKILKIRRHQLARAIDACHVLSAGIIEHRKKKAEESAKAAGKKKPPKLPDFVNPMILDRSMEHVDHGSIKQETLDAAAGDEVLMDAVDVLQKLTPGEAWALIHILHAVNPVKPEAKLLAGQSL